MKGKILFMAVLIAIGSTLSAHAQITTGVASSKVIRTGNRAQAGDFGLFAGASFNLGEFNTMPLINFKYMNTDQFEMRLGLEAQRLKEKMIGDVQEDKNATVKYTNKYGSSSLMLYPGFAYHFSKKNILDVYAGAELPIGWDASTGVSSGEDYTSRITKRSFVIGLGAFIGIQAYIADLPLALGVEYGISSRLDAGLKYKSEYTTENKTTVTYSTAEEFNNLNALESGYQNLKARKGEIGNQIRLTLSYYFK